jgi:methionine-rich copper-binding protein CopC
MKRSYLVLLLVPALLLLGIAGASAHAHLKHASPAVGGTVHGSPPELRLWFSETLEPAFSSVRVVDQKNHQVDKGDMTLDPKDRTEMRVSLPPLLPGRYKVIWHAVSTDTHKTHGDFSFIVAP